MEHRCREGGRGHHEGARGAVALGFGEFLDDIGDVIEKGVEDGIERLGQLADSTLDALGSVLKVGVDGVL